MKHSRPASPSPPAQDDACSVQRDEELWFSDGNLILLARNFEFRVYQGPLITHSPIFKDMLSLPQPDDAHKREQKEGSSCATVHLSDSPEDLRHFLQVFTSGRSLRTGSHEPSFDEVSACVRLGHKYEVDHVVQRNMDFLRKYYTDDFDAWYPSNLVRPPSFKAINSIGVVNLARLTGDVRMLPTALMDCCTLGAEIVDGFVREDGTRETLSMEDLGRCFVGRTKMAQASARIAHQMFRTLVSPTCKHTACCGRVLQRMLNELGNAKDDVISCVDWYASWMVYVDSRDEERELCNRCYKMLEGERPKRLQKEVWQNLPAMLNITVEGWGATLKKEP
ncbi:hypothetical protein L226DRAFT_353870 [Lentinus tigrinus ALCF2SS1-7]|uniref:uncharacterized protein n=1 Tax=Lentinus tigrinus ALCF2SS1-7 TaxID=1328758 RepID=UPI0011660373|nr:hypothetical protein L226DRAFT_353870 [Lentinus tigrinus ALCF2SS1-7]